jgi:hypothetical protein
MDSANPASTHTELKDATNALLMLRAEMVQREARASASMDQQVQSLRAEAARFRLDIAGIVDGASTQVAKQAKDAISPAAAEYHRVVSAASVKLQGMNRAMWIWFGAAGTILLLVLLVAWTLLGYYRRELSSIKDELQRYENAVPVLQAFRDSDAALCGGRICINVDPDADKSGDKRQYRQAKPRQQQ